METQSILPQTKENTKSTLTSLIEWVVIALILYYGYSRGIFKRIYNIFFENPETNQTIEPFQSLFTDDINRTSNEIVLRNPTYQPIYKIATSNSGTYPAEFGIFMRRSIYPVEVFLSGGTLENIKMIIDGTMDMALVDEDILLNSVLKDKRFGEISGILKPIDPSSVAGVAVLYDQFMFLITIQYSNISSWYDIKGRRVGVLNKNSNSYIHFIKILDITNLLNGVSIIEYDNQDKMFEALKNKTIDAIYITTNQKNKGLLELSQSVKLRFISPLDSSKRLIMTSSDDKTAFQDLIKKQFRYVFPKTVDLNYFYSNINTTSYINTLSSRIVLIANPRMAKDDIYSIVSKIIESLIPLQMDINRYLYDVKLNNIVSNAFEFDALASFPKEIPLHEGALKRYEEVSLVKREIQENN
jgi:TRAP transporter TAXI family solute receptor